MHDCPIDPALQSPPAGRSVQHRAGFTLIELLVVVGIIVVLIGILLPVVHKIRVAAQTADTKNWVSELASAIAHYQTDFRAYPGPLANNEMDLGDTSITYYPAGNTGTPFPGGFAYPAGLPTGVYDTSQAATDASKHFTMSENLVLGLLGGLHIDPTASPTQLDYDPSAVGGGPTNLSLILPKRYPPYLDSKQLSWRNTTAGKTGQYQDDGASANDSLIPEFVDRYSDSMPILYMRAKIGANPQPGQVTAGTYSDAFNPVVTDDFSEISAPTTGPPAGYAVRAGQYDISQVVAYTAPYTGTWPLLTRDTAIPPTGASIGLGKSPNLSKYTHGTTGGNAYHGLQMITPWTGTGYPTMANQYPYDAYPYLIGSSGTVRQKDGYILISAGADRVYGTEDDICNFGNVTN